MSAERRVLHLLWDGALGGVQRYVLKVAGAPFWKHTRHGICFFAEPGKVLNEQTLPGVHFRTLGLKRGWDLLGARKLDAVVAEFDPQTIHCHCDTPAFGLRIRRFAKRRLIYTEHGDTLMRTERRWLNSLLWKFSGPFYASILLNSDFVRRDFVRRFPKLSGQCRVLHNPLIEQFTGKREAPVGAARVGVFGRLVPQKGMDWMVAIAQRLCAEEPALQVEFFGDGPLRGQLQALVETMEPAIASRIVFHGYVPDPLAQMAQMTCVAVPSRIEPFGLVALEAQGVGVPVVGFDASGVAEIVEHGVTGSIVPHGDLYAMGAAILSIVRAPEKAAMMGAAARARALGMFSLEKHVEELERIYES